MKKTKIMYVANLSYKLLMKYLEETVNMGFLQAKENGYGVTERGRAFLDRYVQFSNKYSFLERKLEGMKFEREVLERMCESPNNVRTRSSTERKYVI